MTIIYICTVTLCLSWLWGLVLLMAFFDLYKRPEGFHAEWQSIHDTPTQVLAVISPYKTQPLNKLKHPAGKLFRAYAKRERTDKRPAVWRNVF